MFSGLVDTESMFIFNLSSVESDEDLVHGDVHIFKKRRRLGMTISVTLYELAPYYVTQLGTRDVSSTDAGWFTFSVSDAVKSCLSVRRKLPHILALSFTKLNSRGKQRPLRMSGFLRQMTRPFLVVYTNSSLNLTHDHVTARLPVRTRLSNTFHDPESGRLEKFDPRKKSKSPKTQASQRYGNAYMNERPSVVNIPYLVKPSANYVQSSTMNVNPNNKQPDTNRTASSPPSDTTSASTNANLAASLASVVAPTPADRAQDALQPGKPKQSHKSIKMEILARRQELDRKHNSLRQRFVRSLSDNRLPQDSVLQQPTRQAQLPADNNNHQQMLASNSAEQQDNSDAAAQTDDVDPTSKVDVFSDEYVRTQYLPQLAERDSNNKNRKSRRRQQPSGSENQRARNNAQQHTLPYPEDWDKQQLNDFNAVKPVYTSPFSHTSCHLERQTLDFADIGWSEWIIEPRSFLSNFCAGSCGYPDPQVTLTTVLS